jgi:hypothetical protein
MSNASELQGYSIRSLYKALQASGEQVWRNNKFLCNVYCWIIYLMCIYLFYVDMFRKV